MPRGLSTGCCSHPHRVLAAAAAWDLLVRTVLWIDAHAIEPGAVDSAGLYLRQIDVPGVDTKFIEAHGGLIGRLLEEQLDPSPGEPGSTAVGIRGSLWLPQQARVCAVPIPGRQERAGCIL